MSKTTYTLIFTAEIKGHFLEYIHHIYDLCRRKEGFFIFYIPEEFNYIKDRFEWQVAENISFSYITNEQYKNYTSLNILKRAKYLCGLIKDQIIKYNISRIFCCALIQILPFAPFLLPSNIKVSGIIYMIYLHRWKELSILGKFQNVAKYLLLSFSGKFDKIFILNDERSAKRFNELFYSNKFCYLADPYVPLEGGDNIINVRKVYDIDVDKKIIIHFGALNENKGTLEIMNSLLKMPADFNKEMHFILAGKIDDEIKNEFYDIYNEIKNRVNITVVDKFCSYEFLKDLCIASDAIVIPYKRTAQSSGVIGYASQFGKPVIAPSSGLLGRLVKEYKLGIVVPEITPESLINAYTTIIRGHYKKPSDEYCREHTVMMFQDEISSCL